MNLSHCETVEHLTARLLKSIELRDKYAFSFMEINKSHMHAMFSALTFVASVDVTETKKYQVDSEIH